MLQECTKQVKKMLAKNNGGGGDRNILFEIEKRRKLFKRNRPRENIDSHKTRVLFAIIGI